MSQMRQHKQESVEALALTLGNERIGILAHYTGSKNILTFDPAYLTKSISQRQTFTLTQKTNISYLDQVLMSSQRLPPVLSNLLPEGALREWMATTLKVHKDNEFPIISWAGDNLPGALVATPIPRGGIPGWALASRGTLEAIQIDVRHTAQKFSLAGVQMKFSSVRRDGRFTVGAEVGADSWIIKTPSTLHRHVPENEYTAMRLAQAIGVTIPDIDLISLDRLVDLPDIPLPDEPSAFAIRRFDRAEQGRIHSEDFAQIFELYPTDKYRKRNYQHIGFALYRYGASGLEDVQQMARRLLANILLANGDAHLKNWTVYYPDGINARLAPAYDIVTTLPYVRGENSIALNLAGEKLWYSFSMATFEKWAQQIGVPWPAVRVHLLDAISKARELWPVLLAELPMHVTHKVILARHWAALSADFKIG